MVGGIATNNEKKGFVMSNINSVVVSGNLTRDPELRATPSGAAVLQLGIACNEGHRNRETGEWEERPNFFDCTFFGPRAEGLSKFLVKGSKVVVRGRLHYGSWVDSKTGERRSRVTIIGDDIEFMSRGSRPQIHADGPNAAAASPTPVADVAAGGEDDVADRVPHETMDEMYFGDGDIPF